MKKLLCVLLLVSSLVGTAHAEFKALHGWTLDEDDNSVKKMMLMSPEVTGRIVELRKDSDDPLLVEFGVGHDISLGATKQKAMGTLIIQRGDDVEKGIENILTFSIYVENEPCTTSHKGFLDSGLYGKDIYINNKLLRSILRCKDNGAYEYSFIPLGDEIEKTNWIIKSIEKNEGVFFRDPLVYPYAFYITQYIDVLKAYHSK